jgi:cellulose synthase/poly-beta-1,6-N-acetylglucosamine synthase-like glycosyltransferase
MNIDSLLPLFGILEGFYFLTKIKPASTLDLLKEAKDQNQLPLVSVIIPARKEEKNIEAAIESLKAQAYPFFEVIVVDDNSTDRTAYKASLAGAKVVKLSGTEGKSRACYEG